MPLRFFKRIPLIPGLRLNLSKAGPSLSIGHRGGWLTLGRRGARATVGGWGSGMYYTKTVHPAGRPHAGHQGAFLLVVVLVVLIVVWLA
jgi:Protein of unknown function (DUF4236)